MIYRNLGKTNEKVSVVGFGGASISGEGGGYGFGTITEEDAIRLLHAALEKGINLFDTAPIYGFGISEERMGKAFYKLREKVFLVSKGGVDWDIHKRVDRNNSSKTITRMLDESLTRLKTDYIDLYMIHWPDPRHDIRQSMEVLVKAQEKGKIRYIGLCNTNVDDYSKSCEVADISVLQEEINFFQREKYDSLKNIITENNLGLMSWGTLDKGILTGTVTAQRTFDSVDCRSWAPWWKEQDRHWKYQTMAEISPLLQQEELSGLHLGLSFNLKITALSTALCGIRSEQQLETITGETLNQFVSEKTLQQCEAIKAKYLERSKS